MKFDLLSTVESGGCSAKIPAQMLDEILKSLPTMKDKNLLVGSDTCDDAAVYKINDETALIHTIDFFPPLCSDPYDFGQIAAANALSDIYAMGGTPLTVLNLVMFPSAKIDISVLKEILQGGADKVMEAGALLAGGHSIDDNPPKYGLAVTGIVHPEKIVQNSTAEAGDKLILTKPLGSGVVMAGYKIGEVSEEDYQSAISYMKELNKNSAEVMQKHGIKCATDVTGFSLLGHAKEMAQGSSTTVKIEAQKLPLMSGAYELIDLGCIPGASFRNLKHVEKNVRFAENLDYNLKMITVDAQTSGGLLMCVPEEKVKTVLKDLHQIGCPVSCIIGEILERTDFLIEVEK